MTHRELTKVLPINHSAYRDATGYEFALSRGAHGPDGFRRVTDPKAFFFKGHCPNRDEHARTSFFIISPFLCFSFLSVVCMYLNQ